MILASYLNFARTVFCICSRDAVINCRAHITKTNKFDSQSEQIHDHVFSIQQKLAHWIRRNVPLLSAQLFPNGPGHIETDLISPKVIHIENQSRKEYAPDGTGVNKEVFGLDNDLSTLCSLPNIAGPFAISPTVHRAGRHPSAGNHTK